MTTPPTTPPTAAPTRSSKRQFAATILVLEAFVVLFAALVAHGLRAAPGGVIWGVGGSLALSLVLVSGQLRGPAGYRVGSALQVPVLAAGVVVPTMLVVGGVFAVLWVVALRLGGRIDAERLDREQPADATAT